LKVTTIAVGTTEGPLELLQYLGNIHGKKRTARNFTRQPLPKAAYIFQSGAGSKKFLRKADISNCQSYVTVVNSAVPYADSFRINKS
jgi:hypothetical protein